jgi:tRNA-splicing ligase RtcB
MQWVKFDDSMRIPVKSWCEEIETDALKQAGNLAAHPSTFHHIALMPDCHVGYGMPIGGVIACEDVVIPNAVGVDIGCGMVAVETNVPGELFTDMSKRHEVIKTVKSLVPVGEGVSRRSTVKWDGFEHYLESLKGEKHPQWPSALDCCNLGTLGGGNHFIEMQRDEAGMIWLMIHSGSRNLGYRIAGFYHEQAKKLNQQRHVNLPDSDLAFLPVESEAGRNYIRDMNFALLYALENRHRMMRSFKQALIDAAGNVEFKQEVNIHHNYAAYEEHFGRKVWVHRKGATSARAGEIGIIPGSMGTSSYIVRGLGNAESFMSCSHGAGRKMGRNDACRNLSVDACDKAMAGIVFDRWSKFRSKWKKGGDKGLLDLGEAPLAYKDIDEVIKAELDLVEPLVKLSPLAVVKG